MKERLVDQFEYTSVIPLVFTCHSILVLSGQSLVGNIYDEYDDVVRIIHDWENRTGLEMEIDECLYLSQKDVSNYILIEK